MGMLDTRGGLSGDIFAPCRLSQEARTIPERKGYIDVPMCNIDSQTAVPEDLFNSLVLRGKERRKAGLHVLVTRSEKSGGGVKLVHSERYSNLRAKNNIHIGRASRQAGA